MLTHFRYIVAGYNTSATFSFLYNFLPAFATAGGYLTASTAHPFTLMLSTDRPVVSNLTIVLSASINYNPTTDSTMTEVSLTNTDVTAQNSAFYIVTVETAQSFSYQNNTYYEEPIDLTYSPGGTVTVTYTIADYNAVTAPTWVTVDAATKKLKLTTPSVSATTSYSYYVNSAITGITAPVSKLVTVTVNVCSLSNCQTCVVGDYTKCSVCQTGFILSGIS